MSFVVSILLALIAGGFVAFLAGENPFEVYRILISGSLGNWDGLGYSLFYATPFIFTGLAVTIPYRAGLFNIGGEGQLYMGAVGMIFADRWLPELGFLTPFAFILCAFTVGALWAGIAGALKAWRGCHEVITTIMLNFISIGLSGYWLIYFWKDPLSPRPESLPVRASSWLPPLGLGETPLNFSFILALFAAGWCWFFLERTSYGFRLRAIGLNPSAASVAGFSVKRALLVSMLIGGGLAAGASVNEVLGNSHRFLDGFSSGFGFVGIAVAFLGRNHPLGVVIAGIFMGALFKGAAELDIETEHMTRDFSVVLQALIVAAVASERGIKKCMEFMKRRIYGN